MKKFLIYLLVIVIAVSLGFAIFYLVRDDEVITISNMSLYKDAGDKFDIQVNHENKKRGTTISISSSNSEVVVYNQNDNNYTALKGGVARINFRTTNAKFRNLSCDVVVGDGSVEYPFYISTAEQLASIGMGKATGETTASGSPIYEGKAPYEKYRSDMYYKLVTDIDLSEVNQGYWIPLRTLSGKIDGNGLTIKNLNINIEGLKTAVPDIEAEHISTENVGFIRNITDGGQVYNLKMSSIIANNVGSDAFTNFGIVTAINYGIIERVEITDAFLSIKSEVFGGITAINETTEYGSGDEYSRPIARIDTCSVNMILGRKENTDGTIDTLGATGLIGGAIGKNIGGELIYTYAKGGVYFAETSSTNVITYGGLVGENTVANLTTTSNNYVSQIQGSKIKDCYSSIITHMANGDIAGSIFAGAIAKNIDYSDDILKNDDPSDTTINDIVRNYIVGVYYNSDALKNKLFDQNVVNIDKTGFEGIGYFEYTYLDNNNPIKKEIDWSDTEMIVYGLNRDQMLNRDNYKSHEILDVEFRNENGTGYDIKRKTIMWLFDDVWFLDPDIVTSELTEDNIDSEMHAGFPYLDYTVRYRSDGFDRLGNPLIQNKTVYTFKLVEDYPIDIEGNENVLILNIGEEADLKIIPDSMQSKVTWMSSDSQAVSVDSNGHIEAIKSGLYTITATSPAGAKASIQVRVLSNIVYNITGVNDYITLKIEKDAQGNIISRDELQLTPNVTSNPVISPMPDIIYSTENDLIASVDTNGKITAEAKGTCKIYLTIDTYVKEINVEVVEVIQSLPSTEVKYTINVSSNNIIGPIGETGTINISIKDINGDSVTSLPQGVVVKGYSYDGGIAHVGDNGHYELKSAGSTKFLIYIKATINGITYISNEVTIQVMVTDPVQSSFVFKQRLYTIAYGTNLNLKNELINTTGVAPEFSSPNSSTKINKTTGVLDGKSIHAGGRSAIRATINYNGQNYIATCWVEVQQMATITANEYNITLKVGEEATVNLKSNTGTITGTTWKILDSSKITKLSETASSFRFKGKAVGETQITADVPNAKSKVEINVKVLPNNIITNRDELDAIRDNLSGNYILGADIDLQGEEWVPIGTNDKPFTGSLVTTTTYGQGYTISNFVISKNYDYKGLFGYVEKGVTKNQTFAGFNISDVSIYGTGKYAGALVGYGENVNIESMEISDVDIKTGSYAGGLIGSALESNIKNIRVSGECTIVTATASALQYVGGVVGEFKGGTIDTVEVNGDTSKSITIQTTGDQSKDAHSGGLVGYTNSTIKNIIINGVTVKNIHNGEVSGHVYAGGVIGRHYSSGNKVSIISVKNASVDGAVAGGAIGEMYSSQKRYIQFKEKNNYTYADIENQSKYNGYTANAEFISVDSTVSVLGQQVGGLIGKLTAIMKNSYTSASVCGVSNWFDTKIIASSVGLIVGRLVGPNGNVEDELCGVVDMCYTNGTVIDGSKGNPVPIPNAHFDRSYLEGIKQGVAIRYLFQSGNSVVDANYNAMAAEDGFFSDEKDNIQAKKSASDMKKAQTYKDKSFSTTIWNLKDGSYATLKTNYCPIAPSIMK